MKKKKNTGKILLYIASILSFVITAFALFSIVCLAGNFWGISDIYLQIMKDAGYTILDPNTEISMVCIELGLVALVDLLSGLKYMRIIKYGKRNPYSTPFSQTFWQIFFGSFLAGLLAFIGIMIMEKNKKFAPQVVTNKPEFMSDYKMEAMSEAITRLKELKEKGAISEEEYYETLNKILES